MNNSNYQIVYKIMDKYKTARDNDNICYQRYLTKCGFNPKTTTWNEISEACKNQEICSPVTVSSYRRKIHRELLS